MTTRVLVVDDEETARDELCEALRDAGFECTALGDGAAALEASMADSYDVCISDIKMPGIDGIQLLQKLREVSPETSVVMVTAYGDMETAIEALRSGAVDYVLKPVLFEDILTKVQRLAQHRQLVTEVRNLRHTVQNAEPTRKMVGESIAMKKLATLIEKVGPTRSSVLISGESGTGKELIARAIHDSSDRANAPFVPINCAAIPETLLESELFGHAKGAFTGAVSAKEGLLKTAGDGTIFLDELGDMPMSIQAKLLRAIENREIQPIGSVRRIPINARIVTATNQDLKTRIEEGAFREDLYYRLAVVEIEVPSLAERREDIPLLVSHFVHKFNSELKRSCCGVSNDALRLLVGHKWKGNIRELENTVERAMIFSESDYIEVADLPENVRKAEPVDPGRCLTLAEAGAQFERKHVENVLEACSGDKREAAKVLGVSLSSLYRKLETK